MEGELLGRLVASGNSEADVEQLRNLLRAKIAHINERLSAIPAQILEHVRLFAEHRVQLFDDPATVAMLHDVLRTSKYATKKASNETSESFPYAVLAANAIFKLNTSSHVWPEKIFELYLDDALGARMWVDSPETKAFVSSLLSWTRIAAPSAAPTPALAPAPAPAPTPAAQAQSSYKMGADDESSGDEEILEDSSPRISLAMSVVSSTSSSSSSLSSSSSGAARTGSSTGSSCGDASAREPLLALTLRALHSRLDPNATTTSVISGTWTLIVTIRELLGLAEVRSLAVAHLERWLVNPVLFEHVCGLLRHMAACLELVPTRSGEGSGMSLLLSDTVVVEEVVKMKGRIKASQTETYRSILFAIVERHLSISKTVLILIIQEELLSMQANMQTKILETVKLLVSLMSHIPPVDADRGLKKFAAASHLLGNAVGTICTRNAGTTDGGIGVQSPLFKVLIDLLMRVHRSLGISDMDQCACMRGFLAALSEGPLGPLAPSALATQPVLCSFVAEVCVCMQLLCAHEAVAAETHGGAALMAKNHPALMAIGGGGRGAGPASAGRGRGPVMGPKGGRMSGTASAIFLTSAASARDRERHAISSAASSAAASAAAASSSSSSSAAGPGSSASHKVSREALMQSCLQTQEISLQWMRDVFSGAPLAGRGDDSTDPVVLPECHPSHEKSPDWWLLWLHRVLLLPALPSSASGGAAQSHVHIKMDVDKLSVLMLRDYGYLSDRLLALVCECAYAAACNAVHIAVAMAMLESLVHRACRTHCPGASASRASAGETRSWADRGGVPGCAVLVEQPQSLGCLFGLCIVRPAGSKRQCAVPLSLIARPAGGGNAGIEALHAAQAVHVPEDATLGLPGPADRPFPLPLPLLALRSLYWRVCVVCYQLGCARPDTLGRYLWDNVPTVQTLMVMSISSRFFHPPSSMYLDTDLNKHHPRASQASQGGGGEGADMILAAEPAHSSAFAYHPAGSPLMIVVAPHCVEVRPYAPEGFGGALTVPKIAGGEGLGLAPIGGAAFSSGMDPGVGADSTFSGGSSSGSSGAIVVAASSSGSSSSSSQGSSSAPNGRVNSLQAEEALQALECDLVRYLFSPAPAEAPLHEGASRGDYEGALREKRRISKALEEYAAIERERQILEEKKSKERDARAERAAKRKGIEFADAAFPAPEPQHKKKCVEAPAEVAAAEEAAPTAPPPAPADSATAAPPLFLPYAIPALTPSSLPPRATLFEAPTPGDVLLINSPVPRQAPPETIKTLKRIDARFNFGAALRASVDPDFIVRTINDSSSADTQGPPASVNRETIERNSSWLISAIAVNVEVVLRRIPGTACVHLLLLTVHKVYSRMEEVGVWRHAHTDAAAAAASSVVWGAGAGAGVSSTSSAAMGAEWRDSILFSARGTIAAELLCEDETQSHVALLVHFVTKLLLCSEEEKREIFFSILADLHTGYHRGRVARMTLVMLDAGQGAAISASKIEQVLRAGPVQCDFMAFFTAPTTPPTALQALQQHVQHEDAEIVQISVDRLLLLPATAGVAVQIAAHALTHRPDVARALSAGLGAGRQGVWQAMRVHLDSVAGATAVADVPQVPALLVALVADRAAGVRSEGQDRLLALLRSGATSQTMSLFLGAFRLFAAAGAEVCAALLQALEASCSQPAQACAEILLTLLLRETEFYRDLSATVPCSGHFLAECLRVLNASAADWAGVLSRVLAGACLAKERRDRDKSRVLGMAQDLFLAHRDTAASSGFLSWLFGHTLRAPTLVPTSGRAATPGEGVPEALDGTGALSPRRRQPALLCPALHPLSLHDSMQALADMSHSHDPASTTTATHLVLSMLLDSSGEVVGLDAVGRRCIQSLTGLVPSLLPPLMGETGHGIEAVALLARLLVHAPGAAGAKLDQVHRGLALAIAQYTWGHILLANRGVTPGSENITSVNELRVCRWLLYCCYLVYPAEVLKLVAALARAGAAAAGEGTKVPDGWCEMPAELNKRSPSAPADKLDLVALFHLLMLAEGEGCESGFCAATQSDLAVATKGVDYLDQVLQDDHGRGGGAEAAVCALDRHLAFALHVLSARVPVPATLDAGTYFQTLEEFDADAVQAASAVLRVAAERHPALFLRCVPAVFREIQVSLKLASYASVFSGQRHKAFKRSGEVAGAAMHVSAPPLLANFMGREKVQVVFRSRRCVELNECLWDAVRRALLALPGYVLVASSGRDGERSVHDLYRVVDEMLDRRQHLRGLMPLVGATMRDWGGAPEGPAAEAKFSKDMERHLQQGAEGSDQVFAPWAPLLGN